VSYLDQFDAAQKKQRTWRCQCGTENPLASAECDTCRNQSWTCADCNTVNADGYFDCGACGGVTAAETLDADDGNACEPPDRDYATRPGLWGGKQLVAVRAWLAVVFWTTADTVRRHGTGAGVVIALAPVWAGVPARPALEAAVMVLAVAVLARDSCQRIGNALAPLACVPSADLHYRTPASVDPCGCGETATPEAAFRRMN
jgi:hypothetical protein